MITRNQVYDALFNLGRSVAWGDGGAFVTTGRKWKEITDVPARERPALFQIEPVEEVIKQANREYHQKFQPRWLVYFWSDPASKDDLGARLANDIIDALMKALDPGQMAGYAPEPRQTLGGLVYDTWVSAPIVKVSGDDNGDGMLVIPITIDLP